MRRIVIALMALIVSASPAPAAEHEYAGRMRKAFAEMVKPWLADPALVAAIKDQGTRHAALTAPEIDKLDQQWRGEAKKGGGPLVGDVLGRPLSKMLAEKKAAAKGAITELFLMDNKGLNVAQADITTDYMQGDEAKWQKTFLVGPTAVFIDEVDFDQSSGKFQAQYSATVVDPATGQAIGAITVGMDVEKL